MLEATLEVGMVVEVVAMQLIMMLLHGRLHHADHICFCTRRGQSTSTAYVPAHPGEIRA